MQAQTNTRIVEGTNEAIELAKKLQSETGKNYEVISFSLLLRGHQLGEELSNEVVEAFFQDEEVAGDIKEDYKNRTCLVMDEPAFWMLNMLLVQAFRTNEVLH
jgi:precorrin-6x reductase|tara:strand:- start:725 stop:1033 length:309 start_codon:yes stop_codon:yes gene_type:complete